MRAAVFIAPGRKLEIQNVPDPAPKPNEVVLRVERCGICGTDLHFTSGHGPSYAANFIPGHESGAEVVAVGAEVETLRPGDHVVPHCVQGCGRCAECLGGSPFWCAQSAYNMGGFAQFKTSVAQACIKLPSQLSLQDAAIVEPLTCGLHGVVLGGLRPGVTVAVLGTGPIGQAAIFWARRLGAGRILAAARSDRKEALAMTMGADKFLAMDEEFLPRATSFFGGLPEVVFECVGVPGMIGQSAELVRPRGTIVVLGVCFGAEPFIPGPAALKEITIRFGIGTKLREFEICADTLAAGHAEPLAMVTDTISLDALPERFEALRHSSHHCKVLIDPWA